MAELVIQDFDKAGASIVSTSLLTRQSDEGRRKTWIVAKWLRRCGMDPRIIDRPFHDRQSLLAEEPKVCLAGVDNVRARRLIAAGPFDVVIDAGLGGGSVGFIAMSLYSFPSERAPEAIWSADQVPRSSSRLEDAARRAGFDTCGIAQLGSVAVGAPFVGLVAACIGYAQLTRSLLGQPLMAALSYDLALPVDLVAFDSGGQRVTIGFQRVRDST